MSGRDLNNFFKPEDFISKEKGDGFRRGIFDEGTRQTAAELANITLREELRFVVEDIQILVDALKWYSVEQNYTIQANQGHSIVESRIYDKARQALKKTGFLEEEKSE